MLPCLLSGPSATICLIPTTGTSGAGGSASRSTTAGPTAADAGRSAGTAAVTAVAARSGPACPTAPDPATAGTVTVVARRPYAGTTAHSATPSPTAWGTVLPGSNGQATEAGIRGVGPSTSPALPVGTAASAGPAGPNATGAWADGRTLASGTAGSSTGRSAVATAPRPSPAARTTLAAVTNATSRPESLVSSTGSALTPARDCATTVPPVPTAATHPSWYSTVVASGTTDVTRAAARPAPSTRRSCASSVSSTRACVTAAPAAATRTGSSCPSAMQDGTHAPAATSASERPSVLPGTGSVTAACPTTAESPGDPSRQGYHTLGLFPG